MKQTAVVFNSYHQGVLVYSDFQVWEPDMLDEETLKQWHKSTHEYAEQNLRLMGRKSSYDTGLLVTVLHGIFQFDAPDDSTSPSA